MGLVDLAILHRMGARLWEEILGDDEVEGDLVCLPRFEDSIGRYDRSINGLDQTQEFVEGSGPALAVAGCRGGYLLDVGVACALEGDKNVLKRRIVGSADGDVAVNLVESGVGRNEDATLLIIQRNVNDGLGFAAQTADNGINRHDGNDVGRNRVATQVKIRY